MKPLTLTTCLIVCLAAGIFAVMAISLPVAAQDALSQGHHHRRYKLYDMGTFGGPNSYPSDDAVGISLAGAIGGSDTSVPDPFSPNCIEPECFVMHGFQWRNGIVRDLGALPGNHGRNSSYAFAINNLGLVVGISENGALDPDTGFPEVNAVVWSNGNIINLGTFGGTQSKAEMVNDQGQVVGSATNTIPDPFSFGGTFPASTQAHAFLWEHGVKHDLGTLGGPDSIAHFVSQTGKLAGWSYTNDTPNSDSGVPTIDPFLWDNGRMIDLGSLGGDLGYAQWINNQGDVVGYSFLAGDQTYHGFLWSRGVLRDLGTLGGSFSAAFWINDAGDAVGGTTFAGDQITHATLFSRGRINDLGTVGQDQCSLAFGNNSSGQIVGNFGQRGGMLLRPA
jgi:probable HAF family extracellular repeat protein